MIKTIELKKLDDLSLTIENPYLDKNNFYKLIIEDKEMFIIESVASNPIGTVVISPPYGKTAHQSVLLSYYLQQNGFNVIRYDGFDNVGLSSGRLLDYKISQTEKDLERLIQNFQFDQSLPLIGLSLSLSFPSMLKFASDNNVFSNLITVVGVIDVAATVERVVGRSLDPWHRRDSDASELMKVFGHDIYAQPFYDDMRNNKYFDIEDSIDALSNLKSSLNMIVAARDEFVSMTEFEQFKLHFTANDEYTILENATHEIGRSMSLTKKAAELVVKHALSRSDREIKIPHITEVIKISSLESKVINKCEELMKQESVVLAG
ncbi:MAG: hypothetical protein CMD01_02170 [Flavobacteriales bacterium]|nr:hypothetical protein [Flavobacteriales bacterium]